MMKMILIVLSGAMLLLAGCTTNNYYGPVEKSDPWAFDSRVQEGSMYRRSVTVGDSQMPVEASYRSTSRRIVVE